MDSPGARPADIAFTSTRYQGRFWRPDAPGNVVNASLRIGKHGRVRLDIAHDSVAAQHYFSDRSGLALGSLDDGRAVTLWADPGTNQTVHIRERKVEHWGTALLGDHAGLEAETGFVESSVTFDGIDMWTRMPQPVRFDAPRSKYPVAVLEDVYPDELPGGEAIDVEVLIENPAVFETRLDGIDQFVRFLGEDGRIVFRTTRPAPLRFHRRLWFDLRALISYSTQRQAFLFDIQAISEGRPSVSLIEHRLGRPRRGLNGKHLLLAPGVVDPTVLFPAWWRVTDEFYPVPQVLVGQYDDRWGYVEGSAMAAFGAVEAMHKHLGLPQIRFQKNFFERTKRALKKHIDALGSSAEHKEFCSHVSETLQNFRPYRDRLRDLTEVVGAVELNSAGLDVEEWIEAVMSARNKLAHTGSHVDFRSGESGKLARANNTTRIVLALALRNQIAPTPLTPQEIRDAMPDAWHELLNDAPVETEETSERDSS